MIEGGVLGVELRLSGRGFEAQWGNLSVVEHLGSLERGTSLLRLLVMVPLKERWQREE